MTARHAGYVLTLADDIREDDAEQLVNVLSRMVGVVSVTPVVSDFALIMAQERIRAETEIKVYEAVRQIFHPEKK